MGNRNEDYLDQLLNSIGGQEVESKPAEIIEENKAEPEIEKEIDTKTKVKAEKKAAKKTSPKKEKPMKALRFHGKNTPGDSFLEEFDQEMSQLDAEQLISDFEDSLGEELLGQKTIFDKKNIFGKKKAVAESIENTEVKKEQADVEKEQKQPANETSVKSQPLTETDEMFAELEKMLTGNFMAPEVEETSTSEEETVAVQEESNISAEEEALFGELLNGGAEAPETENEIGGFEFGNLFGDPEEEESVTDAGDILDILGGMSDDPELAEIGQMLQAQDNNEDIAMGVEFNNDFMETGVTEEEALNYIRNMDEEQPVSTEKRKAKWRFNKWNPEKKSFLQKLSAILFGDDKDAEQSIHIHAVNGIEDTTGENEELIKSMEKQAALAEKKAKKEEKKKAQEKKNEEKKKMQAAEKKAKAAEKRAKASEKKAKAAKEVDKTPPLPKKAVFLIFLLAASIFVGVIFAGNGLNYNLCMHSANEAYGVGNYVEAYGYLRNTKLKEKDYELVRKVSILASMQELLRSYSTMYEAEEYEMALDVLIRIVGRYSDNMEEATELEIVALISELEAEAETILKEEYGITYEEALALYNMPSRKKYSVELVKLLREVGLLD